MSCLTKIQSAIPYTCDGGNTGILSALLINKEDIASITFSSANASRVTGLTLKKGASAYKVDTVKRTLVTTEALKVNEGAPNAFTHTVTITATSASPRDLINPVANSSLVVITKTLHSVGSTIAGDEARPFGLYYGMSATGVDRSSHDNGAWYTITLATPERVIGEDSLLMDIELYDALYARAIG